MEFVKDILIILICIVIISKGTAWLVDAAAKVARRLGVSELVIGLTIVAIGTSAPEFGFTILAALRGMGDISVGNIVGSDIFNLFGVLGLAAALRDLPVDIMARSNLVMLSLMVVLVLIFMRRKWNISRNEGTVLVSIGLARWM